MADSTKGTARGRRSQARERRRARSGEPSEELEQTAEPATSEASPATNGTLGSTAAKVVGTAVAAGVLGALGGAVKAMLERRDDTAPSRDEPETSGHAAEPDARGETGHVDEQEGEPDEASADAEREPEPQASGEPQEQASAEPQPRREDRSEGGSGNGDVPGLSDADATDVASRARRHLEALLGTEVERVSGLERADGRWSVLLEVVEMARIPESTDVLATYEVLLDDDGGLVSVNRVRRYRRSQVEEEA